MQKRHTKKRKEKIKDLLSKTKILNMKSNISVIKTYIKRNYLIESKQNILLHIAQENKIWSLRMLSIENGILPAVPACKAAAPHPTSKPTTPTKETS